MHQAAHDAAYAAHPERLAHGPPRVLLPPVEVSINPITSSAVTVDPRQTFVATADAFHGRRMKGDATAP